MIEKLQEHILTLQEEYNYYENMFRQKKSLESTLWGLEEQAKFEENKVGQNQEFIVNQMNQCRQQIAHAQRVLEAQKEKIKKYINNYSL